MADLLIVVILAFMWSWDYPADHPAKRLIQRISFPFVYLGLWHGWAMFAPEPIHVNRRLRAMLCFSDGSVQEWRSLGPEGSSGLMKLLYARSFKYEHSILGPRVSHLYAPLCEFLCRQSQEQSRVPVAIELFRDSRYVHAFGEDQVYSEVHTVPFYRYDCRKRLGLSIPPAVTPRKVSSRS